MPKLRLCQIPLIDVNDLDDVIPTFTLEQLVIDYCTMICLGKEMFFFFYFKKLNLSGNREKKLIKLNE
jgi:hypothetical protein